MALLLTPTAGNVLSTTSNLNLPEAYVRIEDWNGKKDLGTVVLQLECYQSEEAAKMLPKSAPLVFRGVPAEIVCPDAAEVLANADGLSPFTVAYAYAAQKIAEVFGDTLSITPVL